MWARSIAPVADMNASAQFDWMDGREEDCFPFFIIIFVVIPFFQMQN